MKGKSKKKKGKSSLFFDKMASAITRAAGRPATFLIALLIIIVWAIAGPLFKYSDTWQLVINTSTTIITFLMVFVIQQTQNKDTAALHLKMNELISSSNHASNNLISIEELTEEELQVLKKFYSKLAQLAKKEADIHCSHSLDEAEAKHKDKIELSQK
jgi:low affinity Fe/Cu permease